MNGLFSLFKSNTKSMEKIKHTAMKIKHLNHSLINIIFIDLVKNFCISYVYTVYVDIYCTVNMYVVKPCNKFMKRFCCEPLTLF